MAAFNIRNRIINKHRVVKKLLDSILESSTRQCSSTNAHSSPIENTSFMVKIKGEVNVLCLLALRCFIVHGKDFDRYTGIE